MPKLLTKLPKYRLHKPSGLAVVTLSGHDYWLGKHGTKSSRDEYDRLTAEWTANGRRPLGSDNYDLADLYDAFREWATTYYPEHSNEIEALDTVSKLMIGMYGALAVAEFGPLKLKAVREEMIRMGWVRTSINRQVHRLRRIFRWGVSEEMVPSHVYEALKAVQGLSYGRSNAKESDPVKPVPDAIVEATLPHMSPTLRAMVEVQAISGMRSGEFVTMRPVDIDQSKEVWTYRPAQHKTKHRGHDRVVYLGPKARTILEPLMKRPDESWIFSAAESAEWYRRQRGAKRKTPLKYGNRPGKVLAPSPKRKARDAFTVGTYREAVRRACETAFGMPAELYDPRKGSPADKADTPAAKEKRRKGRKAWYAKHAWHPHQLRHSVGTRLREEFGIEVAQAILGHRHLSATEIYSERNLKAARDVMERVG